MSSTDGNPDDQKQFKECALYAFCTVLADMIWIRYGDDLVIPPRESFHTILEAESVRRGSSILGVHQQGTRIADVVIAFNRGQKTKGNLKIKNKELGRSYRITVEEKEITYPQLLRALECGTRLCLAICSVKTNQAGHAWHAVAAAGLDLQNKNLVVAQNSWGQHRRFLTFGAHECRSISVVLPTVHECQDNNGVAVAVPAERPHWKILQDQFADSFVSLRRPIEGYGKFEILGGGEYEGRVVDGRPDGRGIHRTGDGGVYDGDFRKGKFVGPQVKNVYCGYGGFRYTGQWDAVAGLPSGHGEAIFSPGTWYMGQWVNGMQSGNGTWECDDGRHRRYSGGWKNGRAGGRGAMTMANGDVYDGMFEEGTGHMHGTGLYTYKNGAREDREYRNGQLLQRFPLERKRPAQEDAQGGAGSCARSRSPHRTVGGVAHPAQFGAQNGLHQRAMFTPQRGKVHGWRGPGGGKGQQFGFGGAKGQSQPFGSGGGGGGHGIQQPGKGAAHTTSPSSISTFIAIMKTKTRDEAMNFVAFLRARIDSSASRTCELRESHFPGVGRISAADLEEVRRELERHIFPGDPEPKGPALRGNSAADLEELRRQLERHIFPGDPEPRDRAQEGAGGPGF